MNRKNHEILFQRYPEIFAERHLSMDQTAMCWGIAIGDGWFDLLDVLCTQLQQETDKLGGPQIVATQVKEKYGALRFYVRESNERQDLLIDFAEALSERICDVCGSPGVLRTSGWQATRCDNHATS